MTLVERYIFGRAFALSAAALLWTVAIVWTIQVLGRINFITDSGQSAYAFIELATMMLPSIVPVIVPFAVAIGIAQTLTVMNADSELTVISASGASRMRVIAPILILATGASVFTFAIDNGIDPYARQRVREIIATAHADLLSTVIQEGSFRKIDEGLFVQIATRLPGGKLGGIFVADSREEGVDLVYHAKEGQVISDGANNVMLMHDGVVHRKQPDGSVSIIRFASYTFDLSQFAPTTGNVVLFPKDRSLEFLLDPDPNDPVFRNQPQQFRAELHRRLTEWLYPLVFALIALAVAGDARSHREARIHPMLTVLVLALVFRWAGFMGAGRAQKSAAFIPMIYLAPAFGILIPIYFLLTNRTLELQHERAEKVARMMERVRAAMNRLAGRFGWHRRVGGAGHP